MFICSVRFNAVDQPEGFINWAVPAHERGGAEENKPEDGETEVHAVIHIHDEVAQTRQQVQEERHTVIYRAPRFRREI